MITSNGSGTATGLPSNRKYKFNKTLREFTREKKTKYSFQRDRMFNYNHCVKEDISSAN